MSLFNVCDWWSTKCDTTNPDQFGNRSLCVATNLNDKSDENANKSDHLLVGDFEGTVRIFRPNSTSSTRNASQRNLFTAKDLILEMALALPILQLGVGKFVSSSTDNFIGILHPKKFSVYNLIVIQGVADHGDHAELNLVYEHKLERSAANFVCGSFGSTQSRDFVCVQSLDGVLSFFEQETFSFFVFLPDILIPATIVYVPRSDMFVVAISDRKIYSYKYQSLANAGVSDMDQTPSDKAVFEWKYNVAECVYDVQTVDCTRENLLVILSENYLYCLDDHGSCKFMKKLDYTPLCIYAYALERDNKLMVMIVSDTQTLFLYENSTLRWATQLEFASVSVKLGNFPNLQKGLVFLSQNGELQCCYLGTRPSKFIVPPINNKKLDIDVAEKELSELEEKIGSQNSTAFSLKTLTTDKELTFDVKVNPYLNQDYSDQLNASVNVAEIKIIIKPTIALEEVHILVKVADTLTAKPGAFFLQNINDLVECTCAICPSSKSHGVSLHVDIFVSYLNASGAPRVISKTVQLPLKLIAVVAIPSKDLSHKILVNTNESSLKMDQLYSEFTGQNRYDSTNPWSIAFANVLNPSCVIVITVAKCLKKYNVQSNCFTSLHCFVEDLVYRLQAYHQRTNPNFQVTFNLKFPINDLLHVIDKYYEQQEGYLKLQDTLQQESLQFRLIQRRLVTKLKEKNPTSFANLKFLLDDTFYKMINSVDTLRVMMESCRNEQNNLRSGLRLMLLLLKLTPLPSNAYVPIKTALFSDVIECSEQQWKNIACDGLNLLSNYINELIRGEQIKYQSADRVSDVKIDDLKQTIVFVNDHITKSYSSTIEEDNDESIG